MALAGQRRRTKCFQIAAALIVLASPIGAKPGPAFAQQQIQVPTRHAENVSVDGIHLSAALTSKDALVVVVFGHDTDAQAMVVQAAAEARAAGYPMRGIILGPGRGDARTVLEFYADSQLTATFLNSDARDRTGILAEIERGYREIVVPRRRAAASGQP